MGQHNARLAVAGLNLRLERRGGRIGLRGPLPCRAGGGRWRVQRLSLALPATADGVAEALRCLREVQRQLELEAFTWSSWSRTTAADPPAEPRSAPTTGLDGVITAFEQAFFRDPRRRRNPAGSRTTWTAAYRPYLRRLRALAGGQPPDEALLLRTLESYAPGSRSRQQCGTALAALARQADVALPSDWTQRAAGYGLHVARFRQLPSDGQILALVEQVPNPAWRLVYGLIACYGLRNHEAFFSDLSPLGPGGDRVIRVLPTSKTGEHQVWPFQPHWVEQFGLERLGHGAEVLPQVCTDLRRTTLQQVGRRVAEQFRRYGLPITPYDLRHAWAVRTIHIGLPDTVAARMMGHSVAIHTRTYHHWITRRDQQQAVDAALARGTGPGSPARQVA
ncbi:site-specific integrase [Cyanobium sp. NIES-981]|uniref:site-specific integrase n=1 Tax=Cyanobium sp. NIES-981 TaxID=1851505 RepID=UPI000B35A924